MPVNIRTETAVLGFAFLVQAQLCEYLYASHYPPVHIRRQDNGSMEDSVNSETHFDLFTGKFDMYIRSIAFKGVPEYDRNYFYNWRVLHNLCFFPRLYIFYFLAQIFLAYSFIVGRVVFSQLRQSRLYFASEALICLHYSLVVALGNQVHLERNPDF